jgi:hypothetical protein
VITAVLGAPGSGKTTAARLLPGLLPGHVVLDWDAFMEPASALAGQDIRQYPRAWSAYRALVRAVADAIAPVPAVLLGVCTPVELAGWPIGAWLLLDCADPERRRRLRGPGGPASADDAITDAAAYRELGLPVIDTTGRTRQDVPADIAWFVRQAGQPPDPGGGHAGQVNRRQAVRQGRCHEPTCLEPHAQQRRLCQAARPACRSSAT